MTPGAHNSIATIAVLKADHHHHHHAKPNNISNNTATPPPPSIRQSTIFKVAVVGQ